ncbi:DUF2783 domain-containing protein [Methylobacterium aquaticum]|jgi:hypothetical protein|uniref:DUF2783 domain-containing protein n=1 Tax=Methylobacterium aquaticum TaxID=270351 RepID=A0A0J6SC42_9HYPH|nr:DUF2783 domain-containing protein [Methylobacterium aquaticum]KMO30923.1 hypothetical protein VP06_20580 [Methylobacterium aquaticum]
MTAGLRQEDGFAGQADAVYESLVEAHRSLSDEESAALNARLVLILAHEVGDPAVLAQAIALARRSLRRHHPLP